MNINFGCRWTSPTLGTETEELYRNVYGESGGQFINILESSPYEVAVISELLAYLDSMEDGE
jgi:hypothetical protein